MLLTRYDMPDGEVRVYCTRAASVLTWLTDDGEGGCALMCEANEFANVPDGLLEDTRQAVLEMLAARLHCPVDRVESRSMEKILSIIESREAPRHPWQIQRAKTRSRPVSR